uniref:Uncharacterized protein n=1 Tax=Oryza sativa subsp. japonica TaxID=39947 RepID=Q6ZJ52_ORYSJ|nr:hypothetical protein [Oryza sativa Japonica Group]BAD33112.1 hypothetical protein [Oryza sativa Japonica Group]
MRACVRGGALLIRIFDRSCLVTTDKSKTIRFFSSFLRSFRARHHTPPVFLSAASASGLVPPWRRLGLRLVGAPPAPQPRRCEEARRRRPRTPLAPRAVAILHPRVAAHHELRLPPPRAAKGKKRAAIAGFGGIGSPPSPAA